MNATVYLSLGSTTITTNNTEISIADIGEDATLPSLICHTDLVACCRRSDTMPAMADPIGNWHFPNGDAIAVGRTTEPNVLFFAGRHKQVVRLRRTESINHLNSTAGSYCCTITTNAGEMTLCANLGEL